MTNSKQIAGLIGPTLIGLSISEAMNLHLLATSNANLPSVVYLNGTLFNLKTGAVLTPPAQRNVKSFPVRIVGTDVEVAIEE